MEFITLTDIHNKETIDASYDQIKSAYLEVYRAKGYSRDHYIDITHSADELELEVYPQSIVLIDHKLFYDGPGCPAEILSMRYQEGTILPILEDVINLFQAGGTKELIEILQKLPKPQD